MSSSSAIQSTQRSGGSLGRPGSLRLTSRPVHIPIPPSLIQSPYLLSPQSVFRVNSTSRLPSQEDEEWLQDTIPLSLDRRNDGTRAELDGSYGRARARSSFSAMCNAPPSPPLVHWRLRANNSSTVIEGTKEIDEALHRPATHPDYFGTI